MPQLPNDNDSKKNNQHKAKAALSVIVFTFELGNLIKSGAPLSGYLILIGLVLFQALVSYLIDYYFQA